MIERECGAGVGDPMTDKRVNHMVSVSPGLQGRIPIIHVVSDGT